MSAVAIFDYQSWRTLFPSLSNVSADQGQAAFDLAGLYWNNTGWCGAVTTPATQVMLMNLLTAHIAYLLYGDNTGPAPGAAVVGHVDSAQQGSVAIQTSVASNIPLPAAFFMQTQYGLMFWQATAPYRTARFRPNYRTPLVGNPYGGRPFI